MKTKTIIQIGIQLSLVLSINGSRGNAKFTGYDTSFNKAIQLARSLLKRVEFKSFALFRLPKSQTRNFNLFVNVRAIIFNHNNRYIRTDIVNRKITEIHTEIVKGLKAQNRI